AFKGHRQTESTSMLRLATAFAFLGIGFLVEGLVGLGAVTTIFTTTVIAGLVLQTTGYFFLAFSHAIDVTLSKRAGVALLVFPVITLSGQQLTAALSILSFYFVLYGFVETIFSYAKTKRPDTLLIAGGLAMIGSGTFVQWLSVLYPQVDLLSQVLLLVQILMKEMGLMMLFVPVMNYAINGRKSVGTV
ncbi:MAG: hypothetical protein OK404_02030, partial [Thaumarchaeota archaeon]|nr:hypothetical protein [Nitrososphaerota archaeon]